MTQNLAQILIIKRCGPVEGDMNTATGYEFRDGKLYYRATDPDRVTIIRPWGDGAGAWHHCFNDKSGWLEWGESAWNGNWFYQQTRELIDRWIRKEQQQ